MALIGERLDDNATPKGRYRRHPPAGTPWWLDGRALDAGTMQHYQSNLSHLASEAVRHVCWDQGPGTLGYTKQGFDGYVDLSDPGGYAGSDSSWAIAWDRRTARHYGPFAAIVDHQLSASDPLVPRPVRVVVDAVAGAVGSLQLLAAITLGDGAVAPTPYGGSYLAFAFALAPTTRGNVVLDLVATTATAGRTAASSWRCRPTTTAVYPSGYAGGNFAQVLPAWLWVGWSATHVGDGVATISAWERRG